MKNIYLYIISGIFILLMLACKEDLPEMEKLPILNPVSTDAEAVNWQTVLDLDYHNLISIDPAAEANTPAYQNELSELVTITNARTAEQARKAEYWSAGAVLRWNEIAQELVSKYNVAPRVGQATDPQKPFAHPPFAARAYALLSVAQQDALINTWIYKYEFNRQAPASYAQDIDLLFEISDLPSYPSEHAVVAKVSQEVLSYLFPLEKEYLEELAEEHIESRKWAGVNTQSDNLAGIKVGEVIAGQVINYAKSDRMSEANDPEDRHLIYFDIANQISVPWKCIETPLRKPMVPFYSIVKTWHDSTEVYNTTPPPPPAIGSNEFNEDIKFVRNICDNRTREQWRIADFWADGGGTSTPPGHWNRIAKGLISNESLSEVRAARIFSVMNRAMMDAGILSWWSKYKYYLPRPSQIDEKITIATGIPNFPSYVSGHSTFSASAGTVLSHFFPGERENLKQMYEEAGISRVYGGIHYNFDNLAGREAGIEIGEIAIKEALPNNLN
ncbi:vanadium-dependent haloperoxidase [Marivirga sp. S37H4]|uniref:Vanadium-dependent haloperoxidase n=1 Tax=Marivirga aurantiaca TaxID=2802615 RepID=A0A935C5J2_9BACT|nr:vanadium-dependent haloperoxidase [Marivirga aurantiaca]MBK6263891.1 vanadium-dependent haloperoxidase [Marivirga aurantiaca]